MKVVFERVVMPCTFGRFPKVFQEDEACFLYMSEGTFFFRMPKNLIEINQGEIALQK